MSDSAKRPLAEALADARDFSALFAHCVERWQIVGSVRRQRPQVGDCEYIAIPKLGEIEQGESLFAVEKVRVNLLTTRMDELVSLGTIQKHEEKPCWGMKQRRCLFRGFTHEVYLVTADNFWGKVVIHTGPENFSKRLVAEWLPKHGRKMDGGFYVVDARLGHRVDVNCEEDIFRLAGLPWMEPEDRK